MAMISKHPREWHGEGVPCPNCIGWEPSAQSIDEAERELIQNAELEIESAQYRALHDRLEDFTKWLITTGTLAPRAIAPSAEQHDEYLFELIEAYLDGVIEHEARHPVEQILKPDLDEESGEPDNFGSADIPAEDPRPCPVDTCIVEGLNDEEELYEHLNNEHTKAERISVGLGNAQDQAEDEGF